MVLKVEKEGMDLSSSHRLQSQPDVGTGGVISGSESDFRCHTESATWRFTGLGPALRGARWRHAY